MHKIAYQQPAIPLSLYIHIPWCTKKCPYCDFNSYASPETIPEKAYIQRLVIDLQQDKPLVQGRSIQSIFFGGGTPSLFSPQGIGAILEGVYQHLSVENAAEITLEANPGTVSAQGFKAYRQAGINRISLGAQSFQDHQLAALGRIHTSQETQQAIDAIIQTPFESFNIDLMYGLPQQSIEDACFDLQKALDFDPPHLSWYHLTLEPNTIFYKQKPTGLPSDDQVFEMQLAGADLLQARGLCSYEVSAFSKVGHRCKHNLNYWQFGDYLGIGAGAHAKITDLSSHTITRHWKTRYPKDYLNLLKNPCAGSKLIAQEELALEFMLNALRLYEGFSLRQFEQSTFLDRASIDKPLSKAIDIGFLLLADNWITPTDLGKRFLNDLTALFLD
ncbi:MAG: radical SAM family heme chaperone HemW [Gammaproteobacteria bacterium]|nr:radical SAM family heme chaperone HemW [Gammaproteobacteria bacterium]